MKLLITGAWNDAGKYIPEIEKEHTVCFLQNERDNPDCNLSEIEGIICNGFFLYHSIEELTSLRYIQVTSAGLDRLPADYIEKNGIKLFNARGVYSRPMAEFALMSVLSLYKNSKKLFENQKNKIWEKQRTVFELTGKKVLIFGCGSVGSECADVFSALGCTVEGADILPYENPRFAKIYPVTNASKLLEDADIVILTLPLCDSTRGMFSDKLFSCMKQGSVFVNISRGAVVNTEALIRALSDRLLGAAADVFEEEPLSADSPLWDIPNLILTPHNSFIGEGNSGRLSAVIMNNLKNTETAK
ncbi:MAG: hydroxyacid dehydrogenase [Ruminococcaceae bacterium]|nr:hydroxyacid dehydrogenase [Oscillospiraceae bacterium]